MAHRILAALILLAIPCTLQAQSALDDLDTVELGATAVSDDYRAGGVNPAALAFGNADGLAGELTYYGRGDSRFNLFATLTFGDRLPSVGYAWGWRETIDLNRHSLAIAVPLLDNVYIGSRYALNSWRWEDGDVSLGVLVRPADFLSLGAVGEWRNLEHPGLRFGIGLRPLALLPGDGHRLTLAVDSGYDAEGLQLPLVHLGTELLDGVRFEGHYDFENRRFGFLFSVAAGPLRAGSRLDFRRSARLDYGSGFAHLSWRQFPSFITDGMNRFVEWAPGPRIVDRPQDEWELLELFGLDSSTSLIEALEQVERLRTSTSVRGIVIRNHALITSYANFLDLREALLQFKAAGKAVVFYGTHFGNLNYALAAAVADRIYLHPQGSVGLAGFAISRPYLRQLLDEYGIEVVVAKSHPHKSAADIFVSETMSAAERETLEALLQNSFDHLAEMIEQGRGERLRSPAAELIAAGPYLRSSPALETGLVDELLYEDELEAAITERFGSGDFGDYNFGTRQRHVWSRPATTRVAVVYVDGMISDAQPFGSTAAQPAQVAMALEQAIADPNIEGILLRVNSPGGSVLASTTMARAVERAASEKPLVISMGAVAASGGYLISAAADHIVASPVSVTGSIGVFIALPNLAGTSDMLGIRWERVTRGEQADFGTLTRTPSPQEREKLATLIEESYIEFRDYVAQRRGLSIDATEEAAQGRVWSGPAALEQALVDEIGGLHTAIAALRERIDPQRQIKLVTSDSSSFDVTDMIQRVVTRLVDSAGLPAELLSSADELRLLRTLQQELVLALSPYYLSGELR